MATLHRAFTFDIWLTLLRSNPGFKPARNAMLRQMFVPDVDQDRFDATLRTQDVAADRRSERTGRDLGFADRLRSTLAALGVVLDHSDPRVSEALAAQRRIALDAPPMLLGGDLPSLLSDLAEVGPVALVSNTGFLPGDLMRALLAAAGLPGTAAQVFSNEVGRCKPHHAIFEVALNDLRKVSPALRPADVLHVGDNSVADLAGAQAAGMAAALVNADGARTTSDLIRSLL